MTSRVQVVGAGLVAAAFLLGAAAAAGAQTAIVTAPESEPAAHENPYRGKPIFEQVCSGCHETARATQRPRSRQEWTRLMAQMAENGMMASDEDVSAIVDYLVASNPAPEPRALAGEGALGEQAPQAH
jgi:cytochrome c5